jgi:primary-amine oxidase
MSSLMRLSIWIVIGMALLLPAMFEAPAQPAAEKPRPTNEIIQAFPANDVMKTAWKVHWTTEAGSGLIIRDAWFKREAKAPWLQVLGDARVAEMFIPYHRGDPRFWDVEQSFSLCRVTAEHAGAHGKLLGDPAEVVHELRDRGVAWVDPQGARRGQTMVLWATLSAANYRYLIEFGFQDDGVISFRLGASGQNYAGSEWEPHMHNNLWRINVDLGGPDHNSVYVMEHLETPDMAGKARSIHKPFNGGKEGWLDWNAEKFTMVRVVNEKRKNAQGKPMGYDLMPSRMGNARHYGPGEECLQHDFWVTRNHPDELKYKNLPDYVKNTEKIMDTDVVLWYSSPAHHEPRSEDGEIRDGSLHGATPVMWTSFELKPRHIFDRTPLYR